MTVDLLAAAEVAEILGVTRGRVAQLAKSRADFPRPYTVVGANRARLWRRADVERWAATADRSPGRRSSTQLPEMRTP